MADWAKSQDSTSRGFHIKDPHVKVKTFLHLRETVLLRDKLSLSVNFREKSKSFIEKYF